MHIVCCCTEHSYLTQHRALCQTGSIWKICRIRSVESCVKTVRSGFIHPRNMPSHCTASKLKRALITAYIALFPAVDHNPNLKQTLSAYIISANALYWSVDLEPVSGPCPLYLQYTHMFTHRGDFSTATPSGCLVETKTDTNLCL